MKSIKVVESVKELKRVNKSEGHLWRRCRKYWAWRANRFGISVAEVGELPSGPVVKTLPQFREHEA